jgi:hypothetical protein
MKTVQEGGTAHEWHNLIKVPQGMAYNSGILGQVRGDLAVLPNLSNPDENKIGGDEYINQDSRDMYTTYLE